MPTIKIDVAGKVKSGTSFDGDAHQPAHANGARCGVSEIYAPTAYEGPRSLMRTETLRPLALFVTVTWLADLGAFRDRQRAREKPEGVFRSIRRPLQPARGAVDQIFQMTFGSVTRQLAGNDLAVNDIARPLRRATTWELRGDTRRR